MTFFESGLNQSSQGGICAIIANHPLFLPENGEIAYDKMDSHDHMPIATQLQFPSQGSICLATSTSVAHSVNKPRENPIIASQLEAKHAQHRKPIARTCSIAFCSAFSYVHIFSGLDVLHHGMLVCPTKGHLSCKRSLTKGIPKDIKG